MRPILVMLAIALTACSSSTEPSGAGDPSILVTNDLPSSWVYISWKDGNSVLGQDSVAARSTKCVRFLAQPDSAYWDATATENGYTTIVRSPECFNPADRPAWRVTVYEGI